jgi:hypothetical protein
MASKYWIKLYHEMLHDPKVMRLEDHLFRRFIEMLLYAGETDSDGILPCLADMAWTLRADENELTDDLAALSEAGLVEETDGGWLVSNFAKRQEPVPGSQRVQRYRNRQRKAEYYGDADATEPKRNGNAPVTNRYIDADTDTDVDAEESVTSVTASRNSQKAAAATGYGPILGRYGVLVSGAVQADMWRDLYESAGEALFEAALRETAANQTGPPRLRYVGSIIKRCQEEGTMPGQWRGDGNRGSGARASPGPPPEAPTRWHNPLTDQEESIDGT